MIRQRKEIKRTKPIARESEKAKARRLSTKSGKKKTGSRPKKKRTAAEEREKFAREYGPPGFLDWIHAQPSVASGRGPCEGAHLGTGGVGYKGDWTTIIPLTHHEHINELHYRGPSWFEDKYGISLAHALAETRARWAAHLIGSSNGATQ